MAAAHFVGLMALRRSPQGSALPRSTLGFILPSASRTETCVETNAGQFALHSRPYLIFLKSSIHANEKGCKEQRSMSNDLVKDIYPATPLQQGLLFHSLYAPKSGVYITQFTCSIEGAFDAEMFKQAWRRAVDRHAALRTAFVWEGLEKPLQVERRRAQLLTIEEDWQGVSAEEQQRRLERHLQNDRRRGFELARAPLMRIALLRLDKQSYRFIWTFHHIALDGWSVSVLLSEVQYIYEALCDGREVRMPDPPLYSDYIRWLKKQGDDQAKEFWKEYLKGVERPIQMRIGRPSKPTEGGASHGERAIELPSDLTAALDSYAKRHQLTLSTVMQGAWAILLSRYSDQKDIVFGTTVSGRSAALPGIETMVGLLINTLPVRVEIEPKFNLLLWLQDFQKRQAELRQYEYSSLVDIQAGSGASRKSPLFENLIAFENYPVGANGNNLLGMARIEQIRIIEQTNYPLSMTIVPGKRLALNVNYDLYRFEDTGISDLLFHYERLLAGIAEDRDRRVSELSLLSEMEREQILVKWNRTEASYPEKFVHELFETQSEHTPDTAALVCGEQVVSYRELNRRANELAHYLQAMGVGPDVCVGLCFERSVETVVGMLAILKAGGAYLPLDPELPPERLSFMLENSQTPITLTRKDLRDRLSGSRCNLIFIDRELPPVNSQTGSPPFTGLSPENLAYVIYTSGSTGKPKGVMIPHRSLSNHMFWMRDAFTLGENDRVIQKTPFSFDASVWEFYLPLLAGAQLVLAKPGAHRDSAYLMREVAERGISVIQAPPPLLQALVEEEGWERCRGLRRMFCGGEALAGGLAEKFRAVSAASLINLYGPTETTIQVSYWEYDGTIRREPIPIGQPIANTQMYVLDEQLEPVATGVMGEIYLGGEGVGRGYLNRAELTAERFVPNPHGKGSGGRLYRTGDLGKYLKDGNVEYLGRIDDQIKLRGYRIELGEIEAVLNQHPSVRQAAVTAHEDQPGERRLVGYITSSEEVAPARELQDYLRQRLPEYMIPVVWMQLEELPLTPHGKVDRRALPAPEAIREGADRFETARTPTEEIVAGIWAEVLGLERVGMEEGFFELGGHSLFATQIVSRIKAGFGIELPLREIFERPTVESLSQRIEDARREEAVLGAPPLGRASREGPIPLSFAQQRLWFIDQLMPNNPIYNCPGGVRLEGRLDLDALEGALNEIVRRHEALRTRIEVEKGAPGQVIDEWKPQRLEVADLTGVPREEREREAGRIAREEAETGFDLCRGPLLRVKALKFGEEDHVLLYTMSHIVTDGWSMGILLKEVGALYQSYRLGEPSALEELEIQYADYAVWQRNWLRGEALERQLSYWRRQLEGAPAVLELPTDRLRQQVQSSRGGSQSLAVSAELTARIKDLSRRRDVTLFMALLAAFQTLLYRYSWQEDIVVGTGIANRNLHETENLIGFFVNMLALRTNFSGNPTFTELLARVREVALGAYAHQDMPFGLVVEDLQPERALSHTPLFQVVFTLQNMPLSTPALPGVRLVPFGTGSISPRFDLAMTMEEAPQGLTGILEYSADLFDPATIAKLLKNYTALLEAMVADPERRVLDAPLHREDGDLPAPILTIQNSSAETTLEAEEFLF